MLNLVIIDYGMGNLRSVQKALERIGTKSIISSNPDEILKADKLILPGVGHFKKGMENLKNMNLIDPLNIAVLNFKIPILGICLGMQLMTDFSEEGNCEGLKWISAKTTKFSFEHKDLKIPHMGWNNLLIKNERKLLENINENDFFYFVHSYKISCNNEEDVLAKTKYGVEFVSVFNNRNIFGCQFHPEKSHDAGLKILKNFIEL